MKNQKTLGTTLVAQKVIELRERLGMNYQQFADHIGAGSGASVSKWEHGECKPTGDRYKRIMDLHKAYFTRKQPSGVTEAVKKSKSALEAMSSPKIENGRERVLELFDAFENLSPKNKRLFLAMCQTELN